MAKSVVIDTYWGTLSNKNRTYTIRRDSEVKGQPRSCVTGISLQEATCHLTTRTMSWQAPAAELRGLAAAFEVRPCFFSGHPPANDQAQWVWRPRHLCPVRGSSKHQSQFWAPQRAGPVSVRFTLLCALPAQACSLPLLSFIDITTPSQLSSYTPDRSQCLLPRGPRADTLTGELQGHAYAKITFM